MAQKSGYSDAGRYRVMQSGSAALRDFSHVWKSNTNATPLPEYMYISLFLSCHFSLFFSYLSREFRAMPESSVAPSGPRSETNATGVVYHRQIFTGRWVEKATTLLLPATRNRTRKNTTPFSSLSLSFSTSLLITQRSSTRDVLRWKIFQGVCSKPANKFIQVVQ